MSTGRPGRVVRGATADRDLVDIPPSRCFACNSTHRPQYDKVERIYGSGNDPQGKPYTAVELRPTKCLDCGQARVDRTWVYLPGDGGKPA